MNERDLAAALPAVIDRVRGGERFVIEREGVRVAVLSPPESAPVVGITGEELIARIGHLKMPGDGFADDIEAARARLLPASPPSWPE